ncbi:chromosome segregation protein SMC, partial [Pseudotabrizicola sp.]|uniref:chromosome segregation protein SMC n=1 Tax=Pseudotabrizicola sp. TaxID=2939647 RepID=UPI002715BFD1
EVEPLADLPEATEADARALQEIELALQGLASQIATRAETLAELDRRKVNLLRDAAILPWADQISEATGLHPLHLAALADLPRRRDKLGEVVADLARQMQTLGLADAAAHHSIAPASMARLRALVTKRDVTLQALGRAQVEAVKAKNRLAAAREKLGDPAPAADLQSLAHLVARLRQTDPEVQQMRAEQGLALRNAEVSEVMIPLTPWSGTAQELVTLAVPAPWQITAWEVADQTTGRTLRDACDALERCKGDLATAQKGAPAYVGAAPSLTEAVNARQHREAAWAAHLARLAPDTAAAFETALRLDDRITLHLAEATAAAKLGAERALALAQITDEVARSTAEVQRQQAERQALKRAVAECAKELGLDGAGIADLKGWLSLREKALIAISTRDQAQETLSRADALLDAATGHLAEALSLAPERGFPPLWSEALARLDTVSQQQDAAKQLADLNADLNERTTDLTAAKLALESWREDWATASTGTPLAEVAEDDMGLAALLDELDTLTRLEIERAELADRVAKMESNSRSFLDASGVIFVALSLPATTAWASLGDRLTAAQQAERDHAQILADLARELEAQGVSQAKQVSLAAKRTALGNRFEWAGDGSLSDHLSACLHANRLRRDIAELEADLARHPAPLEDASLLEANATRLQDALTLARAGSEARLTELTETRRLLHAVGGDDAVAHIVAERANLLNELADQARAHLAQRFGLMAFEQGLRRYRDSHRSAMLARASDAFRQLSGGAYTGLAAQPEGTSEVLVALPAKGGSKLATDLSKGTRFQLYLALRIAGYHELAKSRPPVPFIADDIMETFDDVRAEQAFGLLGDMAHKGQVIYLTHHQHLCDIAVAACPGTRLVDLREL